MLSALKRRIVPLIVGLAAFLAGVGFFYALTPLDLPYAGRVIDFEVRAGDGFNDIVRRLEEGGLIRSGTAATVYALATGAARSFKPGVYRLSSASSTRALIDALVAGAIREVEVRIPEGANIYDIDEILSRAGILPRGALFLYPYVDSRLAGGETLEGRLFPDTYRFHTNSAVLPIVEKLLAAFEAKMAPLLPESPAARMRTLIVASLLEREVPVFRDRQIIAGIFEKRLRAGMPLQVDASVCYAKTAALHAPADCLPLTAADLKMNSPYNTYVNKGLPPAPIGNPGIEAVKAALSPLPSEYWFYLSDQKTGKTIFARNLEEHARNRAKYLQ